MVQARLGDCVKVIKRLVIVVVAVMAVGDLELKGLGENHGHLLVVAGHAVGIEQVVEVGDHKPKRVDN